MVSSDPVGLENDSWLSTLSKDAGIIVAAWGNDGNRLGRAGVVKAALPNLHCIKRISQVS